ncbi:hypothetical protein [Tsukamurella pulmonis]|uniref:hypothetical protein n=1 Tax=Tsukamurella pulmonis TaxID=47312 RepID=UPI000AB26FE6|nr:hypothetical protein [Tsukamurella pulmonis]SUQ39446.1 Uncharacterised protein [Tsukamurella pulmonis]
MKLKSSRRRRAGRVPAQPMGTTAAMTIAQYTASGGHEFAMLLCKSSMHATVVLDADTDLQTWAEVFGGNDTLNFGKAFDIAAVTAVAETTPLGDAFGQWADGYGYPPETAEHLGLSTRIAVTFSVFGKPKQRDLAEEQALQIGRRLPALIASLSQIGLAVRPLRVDEVEALVNDAVCEGMIERDVPLDAFRDGKFVEKRDRLDHDGFSSVSGTIAPRAIPEATLAYLCAPSWTAARRRIAVTYRPIKQDEIDVELLAMTSAADGDSADTSDVDVAEAEAPAAAGDERQHVMNRMGAIVTVSEPVQILPSLDGLREGMPLRTRLALRLAYDMQAAMFAGGLGIGVLLPDHTLIHDIAV